MGASKGIPTTPKTASLHASQAHPRIWSCTTWNGYSNIHHSPTMLATMRRYNRCQCQLSPYPFRPGTMVPLDVHSLVGYSELWIKVRKDWSAQFFKSFDPSLSPCSYISTLRRINFFCLEATVAESTSGSGHHMDTRPQPLGFLEVELFWWS